MHEITGLRSPTIYGLSAGGPGKSVVQLQSHPEGLGTKEANGQRQEKTGLGSSREPICPSCTFSFRFRPSVDWMASLSVGAGGHFPFSRLPIQMLVISSESTLTDTQCTALWTPLSQTKLTQKPTIRTPNAFESTLLLPILLLLVEATCVSCPPSISVLIPAFVYFHFSHCFFLTSFPFTLPVPFQAIYPTHPPPSMLLFLSSSSLLTPFPCFRVSFLPPLLDIQGWIRVPLTQESTPSSGPVGIQTHLVGLRLDRTWVRTPGVTGKRPVTSPSPVFRSL